MGETAGPQQDFNSAPGFGWRFVVGGANGLTGPIPPSPSFSGLPFTQAAFVQGNSGTPGLSQTIGGFTTGGGYVLSFYLGSRYHGPPYDGNQTIQALIGDKVIGIWNLTSFTPFTLQSVAFTASTGGEQTLKFIGLASGDHTAFLSGVAIAPSTVTLSPASLTFARYYPRLVGTGGPFHPVTMTNTGTTEVAISKVTSSPEFPRNSHCSTSLAAGASCTIQVGFRPKDKGTRTGTLSVFDDAPGSPQKVQLTGTASYVYLSARNLSFGDQSVGTTSPPQKITLTNTGTTTVMINSIQVLGRRPHDFAQMNDCGTSLGPGVSCTVNVTFTPSMTGMRNASVVISDDGGGNPKWVCLSGTGI